MARKTRTLEVEDPPEEESQEEVNPMAELFSVVDRLTTENVELRERIEDLEDVQKARRNRRRARREGTLPWSEARQEMGLNGSAPSGPYTIRLVPTILSDLKELPRRDQPGWTRTIESLASEPRPGKARPLKRSRPEVRRLRGGQDRLLYEVQEEPRVVLLLDLGGGV